MKKEKTVVNEDVNASDTVQEETQKINTQQQADENIVDETAVLSAKMAEWQDKYMRLSAEFDNYRKRTLKEKMLLIESAGEDVIKAILPVIDDMERAEEANQKSDDIDAVKEGLSLISKKLHSILAVKGLTAIEANGGEFDTDLHEAIARFPVEEESKKGQVIDTLEKGYKLKDKVIRFTKVVVGE